MKAAKVTINKILIAHRSQSIHSILFRIPRLKHRNTGSNGAAGMTGGMCPPPPPIFIGKMLSNDTTACVLDIRPTCAHTCGEQSLPSFFQFPGHTASHAHNTGHLLRLCNCQWPIPQLRTLFLYMYDNSTRLLFYKQQLKSHF